MESADPFRRELVSILPRLRRFALTLTRNAPDADDLVQTACIRAMERRDQYRTDLRLDSWMFTMLRNTWVSEIRKRQVRVGAGQIDAADATDLRTEIGGHDIAYGNQIVAQILALPEGLASVLLLVSVEGHSYKEAAEILEIPIGTVMSRMSTARQRMRAALAEGGG